MVDSDSGSRASAAAKRLADKKRKTANSAGSSSASGAASAPSTPAAGQRVQVQFRTVPLDGEEEVVATPPKGKKFTKLATLMGTKPNSGAKKEVVKIGAAIETAEVEVRSKKSGDTLFHAGDDSGFRCYAKMGSLAHKRALTPMWDEMCKEQHLVVGGKQRPVGRMVQHIMHYDGAGKDKLVIHHTVYCVQMVKEAMALYSRCAEKAGLAVEIETDIHSIEIPDKFLGTLEVFEDVEVDGECVTIVSGDAFLIKDEIKEHAPSAECNYETKLWSFPDKDEFAALHNSVKEYGLKIDFIEEDDDDASTHSA